MVLLHVILYLFTCEEPSKVLHGWRAEEPLKEPKGWRDEKPFKVIHRKMKNLLCFFITEYSLEISLPGSDSKRFQVEHLTCLMNNWRTLFSGSVGVGVSVCVAVALLCVTIFHLDNISDDDNNRVLIEESDREWRFRLCKWWYRQHASNASKQCAKYLNFVRKEHSKLVCSYYQ